MQNGGTEGAPRGDGPSLKKNLGKKCHFLAVLLLKYKFNQVRVCVCTQTRDTHSMLACSHLAPA
jgi:hypothetical protein